MREDQHVLNRSRRAAARFCKPFHSLENFRELYPEQRQQQAHGSFFCAVHCAGIWECHTNAISQGSFDMM